MPRYIKNINGNDYYYDQHSEYRPGKTPRSVMTYVGPVNPKRKKKGITEKVAGFIEANFKHEPGEIAADKAVARMEEAMREEAFRDVMKALSPIVEAVVKAAATPPENGPIEPQNDAQAEKEPSNNEGSSAPQSDDVGGVGEPSGPGRD